MAIPSEVQGALDRLNGGYNNGDYNASSNPYGFSNGGHRINLYALTADVTLVGQWLNDQVAPVVDISAEIEALAGVVAQINTLAALDDEIVVLAAIAAQIATVAGIAANITTVAGIAANVTAVAGISTQVTTVAGISTQVSTVAARDADIGTVADRDAAIATVAGRDADIGAVAAIDADVATVAGIASSVTEVAGISADVSTVAARDTAIATVAARDSAIATVAARDADIGVVADRDTDIGAVADIAAQITVVAGIDTQVVTVAGIGVQVSTVAARDTDIGVVADRDTAIGTVAARDADIGTVAGIASAVAAVAVIDGDVATVADIAGAVVIAAGNEADISTVAADIAGVSSVAANMGAVLSAEGYAEAAQAAARPYGYSGVTADADPGVGLLRLNNAAAALTTLLYVSTSDLSGAGQAAFLEAMDDSTTTGDRGQITLTNVSDRSTQVLFRVTGAVTSATGYRKVPVAYIGHSGGLTDGDVFAVAFARSGDKGVDGLGAGDVIGPAGATDQNLAVMNGTSGKEIADSGVALAAINSALTKAGHITVTQAVDLDAIETRVNQLDAAVVLKGTWSAAGGSFPGSGTAQAGDSWIVSTGGTVDGVVFTANDRLMAITDNASTTTFAGNWFKADYTDQVQSVNGQTGAILIEAIVNAAAGKSTLAPSDKFALVNSDASNALAAPTWTNVLASLVGTPMAWTKGQRSTVKVLSIDGSGDVDWTMADANVFFLSGVNQNFNLNLPTDLATHVGQSGVLIVSQNGTGGFDMTVDAGILPLNATTLFAIAQGANAVTVIPFIVVSTTQMGISGSGLGVEL